MNTLIYSNFFVALCAAVLTAGSYGMLDEELNWYLITHVFGVTLVAYNAQRLIRLKKFTNRTLQVQWYLKNKWLLYVAVIIGVLISAYTFFFLPFNLLLAFAPIAMISFLYSIPAVTIGGSRFAIRDIPSVKVFLIALVWTGVTLILPFRESGALFDLQEGLLILQRFLFILAITIPFDIRDLRYDSDSMKTIPQLLGYSRSKHLAKGLAFLCLLVEIYFTYTRQDPYWYGTIRMAFYALVIILIERMRADSSDFYFTGILDGTMLLLGALLLIG